MEFITRKECEQPDQQAVQDAVIEAVQADPERCLRAYLADDRSHGGRHVSADLFKEVFAQFGASKDSRNRYDTPVHNPAAVLSSGQFRRAVADGSEPKRNQVVLLTGVPGVGKTTSVLKDREFPKDCRAIFEGPISWPASIITKSDKVKLHIADHRDRARPKVLAEWENLDLLRSEGNHERVRQRLGEALEKHRPHLSEPAYRQAKGLQPLDRQHDRPMDTKPGGCLQAPGQ
ncbi:P-loop NTPase family protein [Verminephrobacter eiseniae]|uniref:hypothetical protein n=1 Tax=Verminephrobacter eiseniae TaxID=364317 RepID=UPI002238D52A|nr:hypothetical protein [Verminephrobacter eiseniae]